MSASNDHRRAGEEGNRSEMLSLSGMSDSLPRGPRSDDVRNINRHFTWSSSPLSRPSGPTSQRSSSGGSSLTPTRSSFEDRGMDQRLFGNNNDYLPPLPPFSPTTATDSNTPFSQNWPTRSATDNFRSFGTRPPTGMAFDNTYGYPPDSNSGQERENSGNHPSDTGRGYSRRPAYNRDEFDGPSQLLPLPLPEQEQSRARSLLELSANLSPQEQDEVARRTNDILAQCAFHFVAKYQFPIPIERDKPYVRQPSDRDWTEWAFLLKRLATKRRIPSRVLFDGQIKQLVTTLENSILVRQTVNTRAEQPTPRRPRDDRYMLQLVSSALQVAKILQDSLAMEQLDQLYIETEAIILTRRRMSGSQSSVGVGRGTRESHGPVGRPAMSGGSGIGSGVIGHGSGGGRAMQSDIDF